MNETTKLPTLIGLTGLAGSGKDTVRLLLQYHHEYIGLAFADPIRQMIRELFIRNGVSREVMTARSMKEQVIPALGVSYRQLAQTLGTEWGRRCLGQDFWLRIAQAYMDDITGQAFAPVNFVVSDVRFHNEADWIKAKGGVIWRIDRPGVAPVRDHDSERQIVALPCDLVITNDGPLESLPEIVRLALQAS